MLPISADLLRAVAPRQSGIRAQHQAHIIEEVGASLAATLGQYAINTPLRLAHFIAQTCHESDGYCTTEEYASGAAYEGRRDLGNTEPGDGRLFKGRGLIQLTGRANYEAAGRRLQLPLVANPDVAAVPATSLLIACDYWKQRDINTPCDRDDIITVTRRVNGGLNGIESRREYLAKAKGALARLKAGPIAASPGGPPTLHRGMEGEGVVSLQEALSDNHLTVAIDGAFGAGTEAAVRHFQASQGLAVDGIVGPATWSKLRPG
jgi:putative chitinase